MDENPSYLSYKSHKSLKIARLDLYLAPISSFFFFLLEREYLREKFWEFFWDLRE